MECDGVFAVYIKSKAIFIHPFSDFSVTTIGYHNRVAPTVST